MTDADLLPDFPAPRLSPADAAASPAHGGSPLACANCGQRFDASRTGRPNFCPACGQETTLHPPSLGEFLHEFVSHYIALEGTLWKTLYLLLLKPGQLTTEYFAGRRRRYVLPLRLYLTASFLFFLAVKWLPTPLPERGAVGAGQPGVSASAPGARAASGARRAAPPADAIAASAGLGGHWIRVPLDPADPDGNSVIVPQGASAAGSAPHGGVIARGGSPAASGTHLSWDCERSHTTAPCNWFERRVEHAADHWQRDPSAAWTEFKGHALSMAPYAVFFMLPIFAALTKLSYLNRRLRFGEHVVFSMHMHAAWFLAGLVVALLPAALQPWMVLVVGVHGLFALRRVYGGRWGWTIARGSLVALTYWVLLATTSGLLAAALILA